MSSNEMLASCKLEPNHSTYHSRSESGTPSPRHTLRTRRPRPRTTPCGAHYPRLQRRNPRTRAPCRRRNMSLTKIFFVLALTAVEETMACNPKKDDTCCSTPRAPPPRPPTGTTPPPTLCARARAEDTDKCKNFLQLIQKNPEKCSSSKNFAKRCRASCHVEYPEENYCVSTNAGKIVPHVALEYLACTKDDDCDDDQFCSVSCHNDAPGCETQENVCQPCDECHVGDDAVSGKCRDGCVGCPDGGVPPCETDNQGDDVGDGQGPGENDEAMPTSESHENILVQ